MTGPTADRLGAAGVARPLGLRVVLDARPMQEPDRAPLTAAYLEALLGAYDADPLPGESFAFLLTSDLPDPTTRFGRLEIVGRRLLPPTRLLRSGALTIDPVLVRGASLGAAWRAGRSGAAGAVYHAAGGAVPIAPGLPLVATLLDLAPWELPGAYQRGAAARFGQRLRARLLRQAAAVVVGTDAVALAARRQLHIRRERLRVVRLAPREAFRPDAGRSAGPPGGSASASPGGSPGTAPTRPDPRAERDRLGLPARYLVYPGRYDARQDLGSLLRALGSLAAAGRPPSLLEGEPWPPRVLLLGASPADRAALARAATRDGVGDCLAYAPTLSLERTAVLVAGARAAILPSLADATGLSALESLACATPVIASSVGALPEIVGAAGILVEPRDPGRLATALAATWLDERVYERLRLEARERATGPRRTWADVAAETRAVYAAVGASRSAPATV